MNLTDVKIQQDRIEKYKKLSDVAEILRTSIEWTYSAEFTANARDARSVDGIRLYLGESSGGASPVQAVCVGPMMVSAYELAAWLREQMQARRNAILKEMDKL